MCEVSHLLQKSQNLHIAHIVGKFSRTNILFESTDKFIQIHLVSIVHIVGKVSTVRASWVSVEILRKPVRFLQFLVEFIQKVVYIKIKIKNFFQLFQLFNVSKNQGLLYE